MNALAVIGAAAWTLNRNCIAELDGSPAPPSILNFETIDLRASAHRFALSARSLRAPVGADGAGAFSQRGSSSPLLKRIARPIRMFAVLLQTRRNTLQMSPRFHTDSACLMSFQEQARSFCLPPCSRTTAGALAGSQRLECLAQSQALVDGSSSKRERGCS